MKRFLALVAAAALVFGGPAFGADEKPAKGNRGAAVAFLKDIELSAEQKEKLKEIQKEYAPKLKELKEKVDSFTPADVRKAIEEKVAAAKAEGKKGKELNAVRESAYTIPEDKKKDYSDAQAAFAAATKERDQKILGILTDEQKKIVEPRLTKGKKNAA